MTLIFNEGENNMKLLIIALLLVSNWAAADIIYICPVGESCKPVIVYGE